MAHERPTFLANAHYIYYQSCSIDDNLLLRKSLHFPHFFPRRLLNTTRGSIPRDIRASHFDIPIGTEEIGLTCVCKRSMLDASVNAVVVVVMDDWFVQARTGTVAAAWRCCRWRCGCCCSTSLRVTATARWLPLLLSLSPFGEWSCPATSKIARPWLSCLFFLNM